MVIDASRIFGCAHTWVSVKQSGVLLFVCASCAHRTELLPLHLPARPAVGRASGTKRVNANRIYMHPRARTSFRMTHGA